MHNVYVCLSMCVKVYVPMDIYIYICGKMNIGEHVYVLIPRWVYAHIYAYEHILTKHEDVGACISVFVDIFMHVSRIEWLYMYICSCAHE